jgi:hypothetical protein
VPACRPGLDHRPGRAAADVENQAGSALDGTPGAAEIDAALETVRGIGTETVAAGTAGNRLRRKEGGFKEQFAGFQRDAAVFAAHDAGHGQRLDVVGDHQYVAVDGDGLLVEQQQLFARSRHAGMHRAFEFGVVEGVQRLAEFEHHVIGDIDQRRNRADAAALEAALHPFRRRALASTPLRTRPQ